VKLKEELKGTKIQKLRTEKKLLSLIES